MTLVALQARHRLVLRPGDRGYEDFGDNPLFKFHEMMLNPRYVVKAESLGYMKVSPSEHQDVWCVTMTDGSLVEMVQGDARRLHAAANER